MRFHRATLLSLKLGEAGLVFNAAILSHSLFSQGLIVLHLHSQSNTFTHIKKKLRLCFLLCFHQQSSNFYSSLCLQDKHFQNTHCIHQSSSTYTSNSGAGVYPSCRTARGLVPSGQIANLLQGTAMNESSLPSRIISFCFLFLF